MKMENVISEEMYVLVAPDGTWQPTTLAHDFPTCVAQIKLMHKAGISKSYHELSIKGFQVLPVRVTAIQDRTQQEWLQRAKSKI